MESNRTVFGMLGGALKAICMMLINLVTVADEGIAMADKAVRAARERQAVELDLSMSDYANTAALKAAIEQAKAQEALQQYIASDSTGERKKLFDANMTRLKAAVERGQAEIKLSRDSRKL